MKFTLLKHISAFICAAIVSLTSSIAQTPTQNLEWRTMGNLQQARHSFGALAISPTQVIVIGGYVNSSSVFSGDVTTSCEIIDVEKRTITQAASLNTGHAEAAFVQLSDSTIIVVGGVSSRDYPTTLCEAYNPRTNSWSVIGSLQIERRQHTATLINADEILVVGGRDRTINTIASAEILNIRTGKSRLVKDFPYPINLGVSDISMTGLPIVCCGRSGGQNSYRTTRIDSYHAISDEWAAQGNYTDAVHIPQILRLFDGRLVISGGAQSESPLVSTQAVAIEQNGTFSRIGKMVIGRVWHSMAQWNNDSLLTLGGISNSVQVVASADWVNIQTGQSTPAPSLRQPRMHFRSVSLPIRKNSQLLGRTIVISGMNSMSGMTPAVEILEYIDSVISRSPTFPIAGRISSTNGTVSGITIRLSGAATLTTTTLSTTTLSATTDSTGSYRFHGVTSGTYTVLPVAAGYTFTPANRTVRLNDSTQTAVNFTAFRLLADTTAIDTAKTDPTTTDTTQTPLTVPPVPVPVVTLSPAQLRFDSTLVGSTATLCRTP